jgi:hypothetical protein
LNNNVSRRRFKAWQFWTWTIMVTLGFACWMFLDTVWTFVGILLVTGASCIMISREEYLAPVPWKQVLWMLVWLAAVVGVLVALNALLPESISKRGSDSTSWRNADILVPMWAVAIGAMWWSWRRSRRQIMENQRA